MSIQPQQTEIDRMTRVCLKRRLRLAGLESDLSKISDITVLRQLLNQEVKYQHGQMVEVYKEDSLEWESGEFLNCFLLDGVEGFQRLAVEHGKGFVSLFVPEHVRPMEIHTDPPMSKLQDQSQSLLDIAVKIRQQDTPEAGARLLKWYLNQNLLIGRKFS